MNIQEQMKDLLCYMLEDTYQLVEKLNLKITTEEQILALEVIAQHRDYIQTHLGDIPAEMQKSLIKNHLAIHPNDSYAKTIGEIINNLYP